MMRHPNPLTICLLALLIVVASSITPIQFTIPSSHAFSTSNATGTTELITKGLGGMPPDGGATYTDISANGRFVAFSSFAGNLVPNDTNGIDDVFVYDRQEKKMDRVTVATDGTQANDTIDNSSVWFDMSANGRYVALATKASTLASGDTNGVADIYLRDVVNRTTERLVAMPTTQQGIGITWSPSISDDGKYIAFGASSPMDIGVFRTGHNVYVVNTETKVITAVPLQLSDGPPGTISTVSISGNGRFVIFMSDKSLVPAGVPNNHNLYVYDRDTGAFELANRKSDGSAGSVGWVSPSGEIAISADGRYVVFQSLESLTQDGDNTAMNIYLRDRSNNVTKRVTSGIDGKTPNGLSVRPSISPDGRFISFTSLASNLVPNDSNQSSDAFIHDHAKNETHRVNLATDGTTPLGGSLVRTAVSLNGQYVSFVSGYNVYVRDLTFKLSLPFPHKENEDSLTKPKRVWSFFDHEYPVGEVASANKTLRKFTGELLNGTQSRCNPGNSCYSGHGGIDFSFGLPVGTPVYAAADGKLSYEDQANCGGNIVNIVHEGKYQTVYAHLNSDQYLKKAGEVKRGERIGSVGKTGGCAKGAHLHFAVFVDHNNDGSFSDNELVDPYGWQDLKTPDPWEQKSGSKSTWLWDFASPFRVEVAAGREAVLTATTGVRVQVPANAMTSSATLGYTIAPEPGTGSSIQVAEMVSTATPTVGSGQTFQLTAASNEGVPVITLNAPISINVSYGAEVASYSDTSTLTLYRWDNNQNTWIPLVTNHDSDSRQASATTAQLGLFSLRARPLKPAPVITQIDPTVLGGHGDVELSITGRNFTPSSWVNVGEGAASVRYISPTTLIVTFPHPGVAGTYGMTVTNPDGQTAILEDAVTVTGSTYLPLVNSAR
jgi:murein DD-endopeptidase MepM/ murein hydrolase activator NlpD